MNDSDAKTRTYHSPLRERQAAGTRQQILEAAAELILSDGLADFSLRDVARDAGVSERTLYYHYPSRQALLDGLNGWVREQLEEKRLQGDPRDVEDLPGRIGAIFAAFEEIGAPARAMARLSAVMGMRSDGYRERTDAFRDRFAGFLDQLEPGEAERAFAVLRHLASSTTWLNLRDELGLSGEEAAEAVAWALRTLIQDLEERAHGGGQ